MDEYNPLASTHWTTCATNLKNLDTKLEKYLSNILNITFPKEFIDFSAACRDDNKIHLLKLVNFL